MSDNPTPILPRIFRIGGATVQESESTATMTNEQVRALLKLQYPEVANATIRELANETHRVVEFLPQPGRKG